MGVLLVAPALLSWATGGREGWSRARQGELAALLGTLVLTMHLAFLDPPRRRHLPPRQLPRPALHPLGGPALRVPGHRRGPARAGLRRHPPYPAGPWALRHGPVRHRRLRRARSSSSRPSSPRWPARDCCWPPPSASAGMPRRRSPTSTASCASPSPSSPPPSRRWCAASVWPRSARCPSASPTRCATPWPPSPTRWPRSPASPAPRTTAPPGSCSASWARRSPGWTSSSTGCWTSPGPRSRACWPSRSAPWWRAR